MAMPRLTGRWCPSCGALVPDGRETCQNCGMLVMEGEALAPKHGSDSEEWLNLLQEMAPTSIADLDVRSRRSGQQSVAFRARVSTATAEEAQDAGYVADHPDEEFELPHADQLPEAEPPRPRMREDRGEDAPEARRVPPRNVPRLNSAIPTGDDRFGIDARTERMPRTAAFIVAAIASLVVIGGTTLLITHPWDTSVFETRATESKDVSQAGYPGVHDTLSGQDFSLSGQDSEGQREERTFELIQSSYERLGALRGELEENERLVGEAIEQDDSELVAGGYGVAESGKIETASMINDLSMPDVLGSSYVAEAEGIKELAGYLNAWSGALLDSWTAMSKSYYPSYAASDVYEYLYEGDPYGTNPDKRRFDETYVSKFPTKHEAPQEGEQAAQAADAPEAEEVVDTVNDEGAEPDAGNEDQ